MRVGFGTHGDDSGSGRHSLSFFFLGGGGVTRVPRLPGHSPEEEVRERMCANESLVLQFGDADCVGYGKENRENALRTLSRGTVRLLG